MSLLSAHATTKTILLLPPKLWIRHLYKYEFFSLLHTLGKENVWTVLIWDSKYLINCCSLIFVQRFHYLLFAVCSPLYIKYFVTKTYTKPGMGTPCLWHFIPLLHSVLCCKMLNFLFQAFLCITHKMTLQIWPISHFDPLVKTIHNHMHQCVSVRHRLRSPILWNFLPIHHLLTVNLISLHVRWGRNTVMFSGDVII